MDKVSEYIELIREIRGWSGLASEEILEIILAEYCFRAINSIYLTP